MKFTFPLPCLSGCTALNPVLSLGPTAKGALIIQLEVFLPLPSTLFHDSPIGTVTRLLAVRPRKRDSIPGRVRNFIRTSTTTLWSTQIHIKVLSLRELRLPGRPAGDLTHLVARLMCRTTHPFLHMPSCRVQGKL